LILIDNYDSFTYNIVQYLKELGVNPRVYKNDEITVEELKKIDFSSIIISPGPKNPDEAGISNDVIKSFYKTKKILGVCLGHQCIASVFGCKIIKAKEPCHGKVSKIYFKENPLFKNLPQGFEATRYHSLIVDNSSITKEIESLAYTKSHILMALKLKNYPVYGVQFHPESILTQNGKKIIENFLYLN
jgi:anthranilate synthase/aminodeoxychorismate synthase-like glutamine amidotransferase